MDTKQVKLTYVQTVIAVVILALTALGVGIAIGQHVPPRPLSDDSSDLTGRYEWQWAGENWFGKITLSDHNTISQARVGVLKKVYAPDGSAKFKIQDEVMQLVKGTYKYNGKSKVHIDMLVKKKVRGDYPELEQTIVGTLEKRHCLVGRVKYQDHLARKSYFGDMILVDYSSPLGEEVEIWFAETK